MLTLQTVQMVFTRWVKIMVPAIILMFVTFYQVAAKATEGQLTLTTRKVVVFKDGYALMIKGAKGIADEFGRVFTLDVPDSAVLGSFWAVSQRHQIVAMRAEFTDDWKRAKDIPTAAATSSLSNLLNQVVGGQVTLTTRTGEVISGKLISRTKIEDQFFVLIQPLATDTNSKQALVTLAQSDIVAIHSVSLSSGNKTDPRFIRAKRLSFDLGAEQAGKPVELTLTYFTPGVRWIPTYRISGELKDNATMVLQGEIINQLENFRSVSLDLVVGVPHFRFRNAISPLSLEASLRNTLSRVAPQLMSQMSNAVFARPTATAQAASRDIQLPTELSSTGEKDLYVYSVPEFSLKEGGRATVPLWQTETPLQHLYTLDLSVVRNAKHGSMIHNTGSSSGSPLRMLKKQIWHQLNLSNKSKVPWTTGAAMILQNDLPLGQDLLTYTSPGGTSLLPITIAVDLRSTLCEEEIERQPNALKWNGNSYSLIRKKGTITLTSFRKTKSDMRITLSLPGKASNVSNKGNLRIDDFHTDGWRDGYFWQNNHSDLFWELELDPGKTIELTYHVSFYVR